MFSFNKDKQKLEFYPKAFDNNRRLHGGEPGFFPARWKYFKLAFTNFIILQTLFLVLFAYIYGSLYQLTDRVHKLHVVFVDYDGGIIGTAIRDAYNGLQGRNFPTLIEQTPQEYVDVQALRHVICQAHYWAALFVAPNSSSNYNDAITGGAAAKSYNASNVISFIWNEARYGTTSDGSVAENILILTDAAKAALLPLYTTSVTRSNSSVNIDLTDPNAVSVIAQPWQLQSINLKPTTQGSRLIYNTLLIVLVLIQDFFYLGTMNGLQSQFNMYARLYPHRIAVYRVLVSALYTFVGSICTTGMIYAFRVGWAISGIQFVEMWMVIWLFGHLNFLALDVFSVWLPPPYVPMALIAWVVLNVTSVLLPFELSNGFYRWGYMIPAHEVFATLIDIWSGGCYPSLRYSLPVLFALEISSLILSTLGVYRRSHFAVLAEEHKEKEFRERVDAAIAVQRKQQKRRESMARKSTLDGGDISPERTEDQEKEEEEDRKEFEEAERKEIGREDFEDRMAAIRRGPMQADNICFPIFNPERSRTGLSKSRTAG